MKIEPSRPGYYLCKIGECFAGFKNNDSAKSYFLKCLELPDTTKRYIYSLPQRNACLQLYQLLISEGNYELALEYLDKAESKYPYHKACNNGEFERRMQIAKKFAVCFDNLKKTDSAIERLTRYMFTKTEDIHLDSTEYINEYINYYYGLLCKKHSPCDITTTLSDAINNVFYKKEKLPSDSAQEYYSVECHINFFGKKVSLENVEYEARSWGGEPVEIFTRDYILKSVKETPIYKKINSY